MFEAHKEAKTFAESFMRLENEDLRKRLAALQSENEEKDREIERLKSELLEAREDYMSSEMEREQGVDTLSRVEAERDTAYNHICDQCDILPCLEDECPWWRGAQGEG